MWLKCFKDTYVIYLYIKKFNLKKQQNLLEIERGFFQCFHYHILLQFLGFEQFMETQLAWWRTTADHDGGNAWMMSHLAPIVNSYAVATWLNWC